jgi:hypothetical protein
MRSRPGRLLVVFFWVLSGLAGSLHACPNDSRQNPEPVPGIQPSDSLKTPEPASLIQPSDSLLRQNAGSLPRAVLVDSLVLEGAGLEKPYADSLVLSRKEDGQPKRHSPTAAAWKAVVLPGWGQIYNRKYWKLPIVYGGLGALGSWVWFNADQHRFYRQAFEAKTDDNPNTPDPLPFLSEASVISTKEFYRRQLDASILITVAFYGLQIVDAVVDAHLFEFDVSDDLALQWSPWLAAGQGSGGAGVAGLYLNLKFRP